MKNIFLIVFIVIFLSSGALAWAPASHLEIVEHIFNNSQSKIIQDCIPYRDAFFLGSITPDLTVVYYYSNGGKDYMLTHNWNFADEVMKNAVSQDEICFAYGIASHLIADSISHNMLIPTSIEKTKIPNWILHPLLEQKYDSVRLNLDSDLSNRSKHMMDALYGSHGSRYVQIVQSALGSNSELDVKSELDKLALSLGTFFEDSYKPKGSSLIFKLYQPVQKLTVVLFPILGEANVGEVDYYFDKAKELEINSFANWGSRYQISPHGFDTINEAEQNAKIFNWIYLLIALAIPLGLTLWRKNWYYLTLIPAVIILEIVVVYAII